MAALFRGKKNKGSTALLLDVENGSVGAALGYFSPNNAPRLFGETRVYAPLLKNNHSSAIAREIETAFESALNHISHVAARVRIHSSEPLGTVSHAAVFMSSPWAPLSLEGPSMPHPLSQRLYDALTTRFGLQLSTSFHPFATMSAHIIPSIFPHEERYLLCVVSGEIIELLTLERGAEDTRILGHATLPFGRNSILRTLSTHAGMGLAEAESALELIQHGHELPMHEPLHVLAKEIAREFESVATVLAGQGPLRSAFIVGHESVAEWLARALSDYASLDALFPTGGTVRAVRGSHVSPFIAGHAHKPDSALLLEALFVDATAALPGLAVIR